ncbi:MAG: tetratricopeptide repeat protein, partial [Xanthomonadales bacterium]|nr:tetratricopeptide repeat protein [Xanthomonadales bacterium]
MFHGGGERSCSIAEEAAGKAIELAPERADSLMARGLSHLARKQYEDAEADLRSAIDLEPRKSDAWYFLGRSAHLQGRRADACRYFSTAAENNAEDWESPLLALQGYESAGDADEARRFARMGIDRTERYLEDYPDSPRAYYLGTSALLILGEADRARRWAERALDLSPDDNSTRYNLACFYAVIGDADRALDLLENSISSRAWIENDSELDSLRGHPRYRNIIESMPD